MTRHSLDFLPPPHSHAGDARGAGENPQVARGAEAAPGAEGPRGGAEEGGAARAGAQGAGRLVQAARGDHSQDEGVKPVSRVCEANTRGHIMFPLGHLCVCIVRNTYVTLLDSPRDRTQIFVVISFVSVCCKTGRSLCFHLRSVAVLYWFFISSFLVFPPKHPPTPISL